MSPPTFDLIIFGATSFVGQILCKHLASLEQNFSWAIAGRDQKKLQQLRAELALSEVPILLADSQNEMQLKAMCLQGKVIVSTVGPYALYGEALVKQCVETGTDYCDLTGEVQWIEQMLDSYQVQAQQSGARIVHCCGFDSIPSDLGVYLLQQQMQLAFAQPAQSIHMRVKAAKGGLSGGTFASILNLVKQAVKDKALRRKLLNPYLLCPKGHQFQSRQPKITAGAQDQHSGRWLAPFIMEAINSRIVHRTNALLSNQYGTEFLYSEAMLLKSALAGKTMGIALTLFNLASALPPSRWLLENWILPKPGQGPSEQEQQQGYFDLRFYGQTKNGNKLTLKVTGDRDPGYGSTAKMLAQAALCLRFDVADKNGGFWTPASIMAQPLAQRLQTYAGINIEVEKK